MTYENYLTDYGDKEIRFGKMLDDSAVGEALINGQGGGGTSSNSSQTIAIPSTSNTNVPITLNSKGFYLVSFSSPAPSGPLSLFNNNIKIILNTGTIQTENISDLSREYYFWCGSTNLVLNTGTNTNALNLIFTQVSTIPSSSESFQTKISLASGATAQVSSMGLSYLHIDNDNFVLSEPGVVFSPRFSGWIQLRANLFILNNPTGSTQNYNIKLSNSPNNSAVAALIDSTVRGELVTALNRTVIAGVNSLGETKTPVLDSDGRIQVTEYTRASDYPSVSRAYRVTSSSSLITTPVNRFILRSLYCRNNLGGTTYIQIHSKTTPPVTGDVPLLSFNLESGLILNLDYNFFGRGYLIPYLAGGKIYIAQSSSENSYTPDANNLSYVVFWEDKILI